MSECNQGGQRRAKTLSGESNRDVCNKRSKDPLEILFSARNLLPVNEKTALQGGLIEG